MRRQKSSTFNTDTERMTVYATDISVKASAHYPGRSVCLPCLPTGRHKAIVVVRRWEEQQKSAEAIVIVERRRRAESVIRSQVEILKS